MADKEFTKIEIFTQISEAITQLEQDPDNEAAYCFLDYEDIDLELATKMITEFNISNPGGYLVELSVMYPNGVNILDRHIYLEVYGNSVDSPIMFK